MRWFEIYNFIVFNFVTMVTKVRLTPLSHIQIKLYSWHMLGMLVKPFIAVLMLYSDEVVKC